MSGDSFNFLGAEAIWSDKSFRFDGENDTVAEILAGDGDGSEFGFGTGKCGEEDEGSADFGDDGVFVLGAKNREIICCFCFPMATINPPLR